MLIKKTPSSKYGKEMAKESDPLTKFMIMITKEFHSELEKSDDLKRTIRLINEFVLTMKTILDEDDVLQKPN